MKLNKFIEGKSDLPASIVVFFAAVPLCPALLYYACAIVRRYYGRH
ncbi:MAG: hypothetical protein ABIN89_30625 [Chitinophagaceae bacterium]